MSEIPRTYPSWLKGEVKSAQKEYTEPTKLLADDGTLLSPGWARHMVFDYDRTKSTPTMRRKEWDFYQISDGRYMIQISFAIPLFSFRLPNRQTVYKTVTPFILVINIMAIRKSSN